jgi:hypothetical protein
MFRTGLTGLRATAKNGLQFVHGKFPGPWRQRVDFDPEPLSGFHLCSPWLV